MVYVVYTTTLQTVQRNGDPTVVTEKILYNVVNCIGFICISLNLYIQ